MKKLIFALIYLFSFPSYTYATPAHGTEAWTKYTEERAQQTRDYLFKQPVKICVDGVQYLIFESTSSNSAYSQKTVTVAYDQRTLTVKRCDN